MSRNPQPVHLRDVVALLGSFPALAGASFDVSLGEVVLVTGPNGAGKTTLLRTIAGLQNADRGRVAIFGLDIARHRNAIRRRVAMVGHDALGYDELSVRENLEFAARASGHGVAGVAAAMERCAISDIADVRLGGCSAGQRRRMALARALAARAELLLLDEPHAGLDTQGRAVLDSVLSEASSSNTSVVMVSHEIDAARRHATREVQVVGGRVLAVPQPAREVSA